MQMHSLAFDVSHTLAGGLVLISFLMLYQDRLYSLLNVFALHALVLALSVAWQAFIQDAPHLYVTAVIALVFKAIVIPVALHRIVKQLGIHRDIESAVGIGPTMLAGMGLVALSMVLMLRVTADADPLAREDLAFALSVVLLGLLVATPSARWWGSCRWRTAWCWRRPAPRACRWWSRSASPSRS
jgi:hydrogenase-4 component E